MSKARDLANAGTALTSVSATELGYLDGVTSAVQTQLNSKIGQSTAINPTIVDAKGDIIAASAADTVARLAVGSNDTVLTADSSTATGLKWAAPAAGANWSLLNSGGTALTGAQTITVSGISGKDKIMVIVTEASSVNANSRIGVRLNTDTGSNYGWAGYYINTAISYDPNDFQGYQSLSYTSFPFAVTTNDAAGRANGAVTISGCNSSGVKQMTLVGGGDFYAGTRWSTLYSLQGFYNSSSTISSISVNSSSGNFDGGTVYVYASA